MEQKTTSKRVTFKRLVELFYIAGSAVILYSCYIVPTVVGLFNPWHFTLTKTFTEMFHQSNTMLAIVIACVLIPSVLSGLFPGLFSWLPQASQREKDENKAMKKVWEPMPEDKGIAAIVMLIISLFAAKRVGGLLLVLLNLVGIGGYYGIFGGIKTLKILRYDISDIDISKEPLEIAAQIKEKYPDSVRYMNKDLRKKLSQSL